MNRELQVWTMHGDKLACIDGIVKLHQTHFFDVPAFMYADDAGVVLEQLCICDATLTRKLAAFVRRDIKAALDALHKLRLAFGDVHVGNIIVTHGGRWRDEAAARCKLIDVEAIQAFDDSDKPVPDESLLVAPLALSTRGVRSDVTLAKRPTTRVSS